MTEQDTIYLDNNATTALAPECVEAVLDCLRNSYGNPSSKHAVGERAKAQLAQARAAVARLLNAAPAEIVFTASGTEANHLAIVGALAARPDKFHVVVSAVEHPSTLSLLAHLETTGVRVTRLPVNQDGMLDLAALEQAITPDTALVSLMWANNETGTIFPVEEMATLANAAGIIVPGVGHFGAEIRSHSTHGLAENARVQRAGHVVFDVGLGGAIRSEQRLIIELQTVTSGPWPQGVGDARFPVDQGAVAVEAHGGESVEVTHFPALPYCLYTVRRACSELCRTQQPSA